jgi:hypothetical protein
MAIDGGVPQTSEGEAWQARMLRFKAWTTLVPDHVAGTCVLKHATKADGTYAGSVGIGAGPDTIITMRDVADVGPTYRRLETIGRWSIPSRVVRYVSDAQGYEAAPGVDVQPATTGLKISAERQRILSTLPAVGATWGAWLVIYAKARKAEPAAVRSTFNAAVVWLRSNVLVTLDDQTGIYRRNEFEATQTSSER